MIKRFILDLLCLHLSSCGPKLCHSSTLSSLLHYKNRKVSRFMPLNHAFPRLSLVSGLQTAERLFWISLTLRLVPPGLFWAGWTLWSQSWPAQSAWSSLKTHYCSPAPTVCALAAPTASSSPTVPPTNPFRALAPSSAPPADMSFPWVLSVD